MVPKDLLPSCPLAGTIQYRRWGKPTVRQLRHAQPLTWYKVGVPAHQGTAPDAAYPWKVFVPHPPASQPPPYPLCRCATSPLDKGSRPPGEGFETARRGRRALQTNRRTPDVLRGDRRPRRSSCAVFCHTIGHRRRGGPACPPVPDCCKQHLLRRVTFLREKVTKTRLGTHGP